MTDILLDIQSKKKEEDVKKESAYVTLYSGNIQEECAKGCFSNVLDILVHKRPDVINKAYDKYISGGNIKDIPAESYHFGSADSDTRTKASILYQVLSEDMKKHKSEIEQLMQKTPEYDKGAAVAEIFAENNSRKINKIYGDQSYNYCFYITILYCYLNDINSREANFLSHSVNIFTVPDLAQRVDKILNTNDFENESTVKRIKKRIKKNIGHYLNIAPDMYRDSGLLAANIIAYIANQEYSPFDYIIEKFHFEICFPEKVDRDVLGEFLDDYIDYIIRLLIDRTDMQSFSNMENAEKNASSDDGLFLTLKDMVDSLDYGVFVTSSLFSYALTCTSKNIQSIVKDSFDVNNGVFLSRISGQEESIDALERQNARLAERLSEKENIIKTMEKDEAAKYEEQIRSLQKQIDDLKNKNDKLQTKLAKKSGVPADTEEAEPANESHYRESERTFLCDNRESVICKLKNALTSKVTRRNEVLKELILFNQSVTDNNVYYPKEMEYFPGEVKLITDDILGNNTNVQQLKREIQKKCAQCADGYDVQKILEEYGFKLVSTSGKHIKMCYYGNPSYSVTLSKTPNTERAITECVHQAARVAF